MVDVSLVSIGFVSCSQSRPGFDETLADQCQSFSGAAWRELAKGGGANSAAFGGASVGLLLFLFACRFLFG